MAATTDSVSDAEVSQHAYGTLKAERLTDSPIVQPLPIVNGTPMSV